MRCLVLTACACALRLRHALRGPVQGRGCGRVRGRARESGVVGSVEPLATAPHSLQQRHLAL
eukprot:664824-Rhodomonas_salina.1